MRKRRWVLAAGAAAAAIAVGVGAVMAQSGDEDGGTSFLDRVAQKLGIDAPQLEQAIDDARSDQIDAAVADGDLTQEQADNLRERFDALPDGEFGFGFDGGFAPPFGPGLRSEIHGAFRDACGLRIKVGDDDGFSIAFACPDTDSIDITDALTGYLGIDAAQLADEIAEGDASLATVAQAHGKSRDDLKAFLTGELTTRLDAAVAGGDLTQDRADELLANANDSIDHVIDFPGGMRMFRGGPPFGGFGHGLMLGIGLGEVREKLAALLGIDEVQLATELEVDGATLASVAEAHGKSRDELKALIETEAKAKLDEAVADGLPQEAAGEILSGLRERLDDVIDRQLPDFGGSFRRGPFGGGDFEFEGRFESGGHAFEFGFGEAEPIPEEDASPEQQSSELEPANRS